ncbi:hypothetical protein [Endozoicomonas elysicola]|uniref:hypothetical protein n=1 Tax=Endozoicomonas elysicola TaxID=305900 RepID=UPI00037A685B|nr:hypothetical protein [Endozoicomonas elysicola]
MALPVHHESYQHVDDDDDGDDGDDGRDNGNDAVPYRYGLNLALSLTFRINCE